MRNRKVTKRQVQLVQDNVEMILLGFIYDRHMQGRPCVFFGADENDIPSIEKLKNIHGIQIVQEKTKPNHWEYYIQPECIEKARQVLNSFWREVWQ